MNDLCLLLQGFIFICATGAAPKLLLVTLCAAWCPLAWTGHGERKYLGLGVIFYSDTQWKIDVWGFLRRAFFPPHRGVEVGILPREQCDHSCSLSCRDMSLPSSFTCDPLSCRVTDLSQVGAGSVPLLRAHPGSCSCSGIPDCCRFVPGIEQVCEHQE